MDRGSGPGDVPPHWTAFTPPWDTATALPDDVAFNPAASSPLANGSFSDRNRVWTTSNGTNSLAVVNRSVTRADRAFWVFKVERDDHNNEGTVFGAVFASPPSSFDYTNSGNPGVFYRGALRCAAGVKTGSVSVQRGVYARQILHHIELRNKPGASKFPDNTPCSVAFVVLVPRSLLSCASAAYNGQLYGPPSNRSSTSNRRPAHPNDSVIFHWDGPAGTLHLFVNGADQGVCWRFTAPAVTLFPAAGAYMNNKAVRLTGFHRMPVGEAFPTYSTEARMLYRLPAGTPSAPFDRAISSPAASLLLTDGGYNMRSNAGSNCLAVVNRQFRGPAARAVWSFKVCTAVALPLPAEALASVLWVSWGCTVRAVAAAPPR
jgi:hypothetical protein